MSYPPGETLCQKETGLQVKTGEKREIFRSGCRYHLFFRTGSGNFKIHTLYKQRERTVDFLKKILEPTKIPKPTRKRRGGLRDISELTAESVERVCGEFYDPWFDPKVTITYKTMTFNTSCVKYFPTTQSAKPT